MKDQFSVPLADAQHVVSKFLKNFRNCPDNGKMELDEWRLALWVDALSKKYANIAEEVYMQWVDLRYRYLSLSPAVSTLLSTLRHHYLLALITNGPSGAQWEKVQRLELCDYLMQSWCLGIYLGRSPHKNIFLQACHSLGVEPENCLMVGDKLETDIQGGVNAHLGGTVWVMPSYGIPDVQESNLLADFTLTTVSDLLDILPSQPECPSISHVRLSDYPLSWKNDPCSQHQDDEKCNVIINHS